MLGARGFQNGSDYVVVLLINKIHFQLGSLAVRHAGSDCLIDELLQVVDSHAIRSPLIMSEELSDSLAVEIRRVC